MTRMTTLMLKRSSSDIIHLHKYQNHFCVTHGLSHGTVTPKYTDASPAQLRKSRTAPYVTARNQDGDSTFGPPIDAPSPTLYVDQESSHCSLASYSP